jgi:hypothetical protein
MIMFRQKNFGKVNIFRKGSKIDKAVEKGKDIWNNNKAEIGVIGTGISALNLGINVSRGNNEKKFQKEQIDATKKLTDAIENSNQEELKKNKKLVKKSQKPYTRNYYLPKPVENLKDKSLETINIKRKS